MWGHDRGFFWPPATAPLRARMRQRYWSLLLVPRANRCDRLGELGFEEYRGLDEILNGVTKAGVLEIEEDRVTTGRDNEVVDIHVVVNRHRRDNGRARFHERPEGV